MSGQRPQKVKSNPNVLSPSNAPIQSPKTSSSSYKQELMEARLLLDSVNDLVAYFDSNQSRSHTLQDDLFTPIPIISKSAKNITHRPSKLKSKSLKANYYSNNKNLKRISPDLKSTREYATPELPFGVSTTSPHHVPRIKDDMLLTTTIRNKKNNESKKTTKTSLNIPIISKLEEVPSFVKKNERRVELLKEMIEIKRNELLRVQHRHVKTIDYVVDLYLKASESINKLRRHHRQLCLFAEKLSRNGKLRNTLVEDILQSLSNIENQRKELLNKIENPAWEVKHHFHILSFQHFLGSQQPHLMDIAEVLPSRLQIASIARNTVKKNDKLLILFHKAQKERDLLKKKLSQVDKRRTLTQAHLKDYKKMMTIIKKNIGETRLEKLKKERIVTKKKELQKEKIPKINDYVMMRMGNMSPFHDHNRMTFLRELGLYEEKKEEFNIREYVTKVNEFLDIPDDITKLELKELDQTNDLINPVTGVKQDMSEKKEDEKKGTDTNEETIKEEKKNKKKPKIIHRLKFKEKSIKNNKIFSIINKYEYKIKETKDDNKIKYTIQKPDDKDFLDDEIETKSNNSDSETQVTETLPETKTSFTMDNIPCVRDIEAPHRDWSVLAKHLKDSSKELNRRKQIQKQLETILLIKEGLASAFKQLKEQHVKNLQDKI